MRIKIAPSILSANFAHLQDDVDKISNADVLHIDVMDGHFVNNITIGPVVIKDIKTNLLKESHLMIQNPGKYIKPFVEAGSQRIIFHAETVKDTEALIEEIKKHNVEVGVSLNPDSPLSMIKPYLEKLDMVLLMTVFPGFGGQKFIDSVVPKIKELRGIFEKDIEVDGGINFETAKIAAEAGANLLVAGSFVFKNKEHLPAKVVEMLKNI
ncbi:ribulose-phosphate 3-epimerase [Candidatus Woesearchaeota archaeon]|nr:ribulose-phosphate 3-epimerase [Candidatus Woesearchaeota archaeon]